MQYNFHFGIEKRQVSRNSWTPRSLPFKCKKRGENNFLFSRESIHSHLSPLLPSFVVTVVDVVPATISPQQWPYTLTHRLRSARRIFTSALRILATFLYLPISFIFPFLVAAWLPSRSTQLSFHRCCVSRHPLQTYGCFHSSSFSAWTLSFYYMRIFE